MIVRASRIPGAALLEIERLDDERGFFARVWSERECADAGLATGVSQCSVSFNRSRGTTRGLHFQADPYGEDKVVRCTRGAIFDVVVDVRPESPAFLQWEAYELTDENRSSLYIPKGCAHGFQTLVDDTEVFYMISVPYRAEAARTIRWNDERIGIAWPEREQITLSPKDAQAPTALELLGR